MKILPRTRTPNLVVETVGGDTWELAAERPKALTLLVFYRGHHCPLCKKQLAELQQLSGEFEAAGIRVVAVSVNSRELAERTVEEWGLESLTVGYELGLDDADRWGLFVSAAVKDTEPDRFVEPGLFIIRPDGTLYASIVQTMPFARPPAKQLLSTLTWILENDYPARGEARPEASAPAPGA